MYHFSLVLNPIIRGLFDTLWCFYLTLCTLIAFLFPTHISAICGVTYRTFATMTTTLLVKKADVEFFVTSITNFLHLHLIEWGGVASIIRYNPPPLQQPTRTPGWTRTSNRQLRRLLLYPLSYEGSLHSSSR